jgi:hypothetical protein
MSTPTIFGYEFSDIQRAQAGGSLCRESDRLRPVVPEAHKAQIERDVARFRISVTASVVSQYAIALPAGYHLDGDTYVFRSPKAPGMVDG